VFKPPFPLTNVPPAVTLLKRGFRIPLKPDHQSGALNNRIVVHASRAPYIVFGVMFVGIGVLCLFLGLLVERSFLNPGATFLAAYGVVVLWLRSFEVKLDGEGVVCTSIFGSKALQWDEIDRAELRLGYRPKYEQDEPGQAFRALFRLVIFSKPTSAKPPVRINIKLLNRTDIQILVERLEASVAGCKLNVPSWMAPLARD
jgi:hypothetical protein